MKHHLYDPLTYRFPRSIAETEDSRFRWWVSGDAAQAEEQQLREQLEDAPAKGVRLGAIVGVAVVVFILALDVLVLR